jgi:ParB family chromosome partitioning protein
LIVRRTGIDRFELIAGERRLKAAQAAGLDRVPVVVREADRAEMLELALIENLHREDLNPMEEAEAYHRLAAEFNRSQETIARLAGRDRSTVANLLRLLQLPAPVQEDVRHGRLTTGHARALLALSDPDRIMAVREQVLARQLSVRATEALVKSSLRRRDSKKKTGADDIFYQTLAEELTRVLGARSKIVSRGRRGRIEITFSSTQELERLIRNLGVKLPV